MTRDRAGRSEQGSALLLAIILTVLLAAVGAAAMLAGHSETLIAAHFRQGHEAVYVAEGALSRAIRDIADLPAWTAILSGVATSTFVDGPSDVSKRLPTGGMVVLCCGGSSQTVNLQVRGNGAGDWGANTPQWRIYSWGPASAWLPDGNIQSVFYTVVWASDDVADGDGDPAVDSNGTIALNSLAIGPQGARRAVHALVQRVATGGGQPRVRVLSSRETRW
ncbi:MAG: PilX N-terminal domain-containing pilus assembly protein [Vicinamibacterales bacterium]